MSRRRGGPTCNRCGRPVLFAVQAHNHRRRPFDPKPVRPWLIVHRPDGTPLPAMVIENQTTAWRGTDLEEDLPTRGLAVNVADELAAMPWHLPHVCSEERGTTR